MKYVKIKNFEHFLMEILSIGKKDDGLHGGMVLATNEDGSLKTYTKDNQPYAVVVGSFPVTLLFRGQNADYPLVPKLARIAKGSHLLRTENLMISEIKRRTNKLYQPHSDNWDMLVYSQHYGLATRLLDWTTNPLVALWFACADEENKNSTFVYLLKQSDENMVDISKDTDPFKISETKILKPNLNNDRIVAQNGWFTVHTIDEDERNFKPLNEDLKFKDELWKFEIPGEQKELILIKLNMLGINHEYIYPGFEGTCMYINWKHKN